ncbi:hypothetical protein AB6735_03490 [Mucilaginibacter sp. RCC_168]|uniref:hypothetical protein n=1 Tax=Mucilaginibacter sp. RCC_168 TaxID=3239221 RepID=UPI0035265BEC
MEDVLSYVARQMNISREKASELTGLANDAVAEVLDTEHPLDHSPEFEEVLKQEEDLVDLNEISKRLKVQLAELCTWVEDDLIFIEYGRNLAEGVTAEGPTAQSATANFYCRWYNDVLIKHQGVLLNDNLRHLYNEGGETSL